MSLCTWRCAQGHSHARTAKCFPQTTATIWIHPMGLTVCISCSIKKTLQWPQIIIPPPPNFTVSSHYVLCHLQNPDLPNSESWWSVQLMLDYMNGDMRCARSCSAMKPNPLCVDVASRDRFKLCRDWSDARPFFYNPAVSAFIALCSC